MGWSASLQSDKETARKLWLYYYLPPLFYFSVVIKFLCAVLTSDATAANTEWNGTFLRPFSVLSSAYNHIQHQTGHLAILINGTYKIMAFSERILKWICLFYEMYGYSVLEGSAQYNPNIGSNLILSFLCPEISSFIFLTCVILAMFDVAVLFYSSASNLLGVVLWCVDVRYTFKIQIYPKANLLLWI